MSLLNPTRLSQRERELETVIRLGKVSSRGAGIRMRTRYRQRVATSQAWVS